MIDEERLLICVKDCFSPEFYDKYDFEKIVERATLFNNGECIKCVGSNFTLIVDSFNYSVRNLEIYEVEV